MKTSDQTGDLTFFRIPLRTTDAASMGRITQREAIVPTAKLKRGKKNPRVNGQMIKSFSDGFAKKSGELLANALGPLLLAAFAFVLGWFGSPAQLSVTRVGLLLIGLSVIVLLACAYAVGFFVAKRRYKPRVPTVDTLQAKVLSELWAHGQNTVTFENMQKRTRAHGSDLTLAGERLQQHGLIAYNATGPASLMQLLKEGREYVKANALDELPTESLADRIAHLDD